MTAELSLEERVARIEDILGLGAASNDAPVPWPLRRQAVMTEAARLWGLTVEDLTGRVKTRDYVLPRAAVVMALRCHPPMSYPQIGRLLGRDHSSIINLERIGQAERARDVAFAARATVLQQIAHKPEETAS